MQTTGCVGRMTHADIACTVLLMDARLVPAQANLVSRALMRAGLRVAVRGRGTGSSVTDRADPDCAKVHASAGGIRRVAVTHLMCHRTAKVTRRYACLFWKEKAPVKEGNVDASLICRGILAMLVFVACVAGPLLLGALSPILIRLRR